MLVKEARFQIPALALLSLSLLLAVVSLHNRRLSTRQDLLIPGVCLFVQWIVLAALMRALVPHFFWLAAVAPVVVVFRRLREGKLAYLLVAAHFLIGLAFIQFAGVPKFDIYVFQRDAAAALLSGTNPYSITFPNIHHPYTGFYAPEFVQGARVTAGFPYLPASLLMALPGFLLGDVRLSHLAATSLSGALMLSMSRQPLARLAVVLFLFSPVTFWIVAIGWTEPLLLVLLAGAGWAYRRSSVVLGAILFGVLLAAKQYIVLVTPLIALLPLPHPRRALFTASLCGILLVAPFALADIHGFFRATVWWQFAQPFRPDSLSFAALIASLGGPRIAWLNFLAFPLAVLFLIRRCPRTLAGLLTAVSVAYFVFFILAKQAFLNYYFLVFGTLCCAIAMAEPSPGDRP